MHSVIPTLLAAATLGSFVAADNIYVYTKPSCGGSAFFFKDIDHNICAVSITGNASSIADAIAKNLTTVHSAKLEVQEYGTKHFLGWDEGPRSNADGPLQCGTIAAKVPVTERDTCISGTAFHGFSWTEPGSGEDSKHKRQTAGDVWTCTGSTEPDAVFIGGKHYTTSGIDTGDAQELKSMAMNNDDNVPASFEKYTFTPES